MANMKKYTRGALGHMLAHYERRKDRNGDYIKFGNQNIDTKKTYQNYNLHDRRDNLTDYEFIDQYTKSLKVMNRKDVNLMCSWVVTLPEGLKTASKQDQEKFFQEVYNFNSKRYGKNTVVSAYVHLDETTPHMHFAFVPVVFDKKKSRYKVSAKERVNINDLKTYHTDLSKHMEKAFGRDIGIVTAPEVGKNTKTENKTIAQLKKENSILANTNNDLQEENLYLESVNSGLMADNQQKGLQYDKLREKNFKLNKKNAELSRKLEDKQAIFKENEELKNSVESMSNYMKGLNFQSGKNLYDGYFEELDKKQRKQKQHEEEGYEW